MSSLLARLARTLTHHWKRGLAGAVVVIVLLGAAAGAGGEAADDFSIPGTESQQAIDLFKAHSPAFAGADSTLVFYVEDGKVSDTGPRAGITGALQRVRGLDAAETAERGGVEVAARGILIDLASEQEAPVGELIGVGIAVLLLTLLFRSLAAMAATLVGALVGVMVGQILLAALAQPLGLPQFATVIAVMLGLGAGIDYALLIIGRYREQVASG